MNIVGNNIACRALSLVVQINILKLHPVGVMEKITILYLLQGNNASCFIFYNTLIATG
jgi:hypothetical protein